MFHLWEYIRHLYNTLFLFRHSMSTKKKKFLYRGCILGKHQYDFKSDIQVINHNISTFLILYIYEFNVFIVEMNVYCVWKTLLKIYGKYNGNIAKEAIRGNLQLLNDFAFQEYIIEMKVNLSHTLTNM